MIVAIKDRNIFGIEGLPFGNIIADIYTLQRFWTCDKMTLNSSHRKTFMTVWYITCFRSDVFLRTSKQLWGHVPRIRTRVCIGSCRRRELAAKSIIWIVCLVPEHHVLWSQFRSRTFTYKERLFFWPSIVVIKNANVFSREVLQFNNMKRESLHTMFLDLK